MSTEPFERAAGGSLERAAGGSLARAGFPTSARSVLEWLTAIRMEQYAEQLGSVPVEQLRLLTADDCARLGIVLPGHRNRILLAAQHLLESAARPPARMDVDDGGAGGEGDLPPRRGRPSVDLSGSLVARAQKMMQANGRRLEGGGHHGRGAEGGAGGRANSTSSLFISSTIMKPQIAEVIYCVAIVLHDQIIAEEVEAHAPGAGGGFGGGCGWGVDASAGGGADHDPDVEYLHIGMQVDYPFFSEDNNPLYAEPEDGARLRRTRVRRQRLRPSEAFIADTIKSVYDCAHFSVECVIIALIYIERLLDNSEAKVLSSTWRPIVLAAIIVAQKVFDDNSLTNVDFSTYCPMFSLREINFLENKFLELLSYNVSVSASTYASFFFRLQTLCQQQAPSGYRQPLNLEAARSIEARVSQRQAELHEARKTRSDTHPILLGRRPAVMN